MSNKGKISKEEISRLRLENELKAKEKLAMLRSIVREYPLHEYLALLSAFLWPRNKVSQYFDEKIGNEDAIGVMYQIYIPALAKFAINNSNDFVGISNLPFEKAFKDVKRCIILINDLKDKFPFQYVDDPELALSSIEFQIANQHFPFQVNLEILNNMLARSLILFREIPESKSCGIDISGAFKSIFKISLKKFWIITARLIGHRIAGWFSFNNFTGLDQMAYELTKSDLKNYFDVLSIEYEQFRAESSNAKKSFTGATTQFYGYSPFDSYPILKRGEQFLIPSPHYLVWRVFLPVYFDLLQYFQLGDNLKKNPFSEIFGMIFQDYVGMQLELIKDGSMMIPEIDYDRDNKKYTDYTLLYDDSAISIEVKKNLLPLKAKFNLDERLLNQKLIDSLVKGLKQIYNKIEHAKQKMRGLEFLSHVKNFYPVIITFDDTYRLNLVYAAEKIFSTFDKYL